MRPDSGDILISGGRVIDPSQRVDREADVLIRGGLVAEIGVGLAAPEAQLIDARDRIVCPGLIDMHVHLREPGEEHKETIQTGTRAALAGGFTTVCCMPNTRPRLHSRQVLADLRLRLEREADCGVVAIGWAGATLPSGWEALAELLEAGHVRLVSDDGDAMQDRGQLRRVLEACAGADVAFIAHCESARLAPEGWVMNAGQVAEELGVVGLPPEAESEAAAQLVEVAEETGARVHVAHVSARQTVQVVRAAKERGVSVTAEACPHHFTLTAEAVREQGANAKMSPPLRTKADVEAIKEGLADGTIEVIATDHAPHTVEEKARGLVEAPCGVVGLETCVGLVLTELVEAGVLSLAQAVEKMTIGPARVAKLDTGTLAPGSPADVTVIDPEAEWTVDPEQFESKGRNTPFGGRRLKGRAWATIVGGEARMMEGRVTQQARMGA
ncbi:MAG: dihydroorotase [Armatimonadota bacterium]